MPEAWKGVLQFLLGHYLVTTKDLELTYRNSAPRGATRGVLAVVLAGASVDLASDGRAAGWWMALPGAEAPHRQRLCSSEFGSVNAEVRCPARVVVRVRVADTRSLFHGAPHSIRDIEISSFRGKSRV